MTVIATHALLSSGAAAQSPPGCAVCEQGHIYGSTGFDGSYAVTTASGTVPNTYCITQGLNYPNSQHGGPAPTDYADQGVWAALFDLAAPSDQDKAAVSMRVHRDLEGNAIEWTAFAGLRERSDALWNQAAALAGPYATVLEIRQSPERGNGGHGIAAVRVQAASGAPLPDASVQLTGVNVSIAATVRTGPAGIAEIPFSVSAPGEWELRAEGTQLPAVTVVRYDAIASEQTVIGSGPRTTGAPASASGALDVPTRVSIAKADARTGAAVAGAVIEIRDEHGALAATVVTAETPLPIDLAAGSYSAREVREPDGYLIDDAAERPFAVTLLGGSLDLVWSDTPAEATIGTRASATRVAVGDQVHDLITVAGLPPSLEPFTALVRYLGPVPPAEAGGCQALPAAAFAEAAVIAQAQVTIPGNGDVRTPAFTAPRGRGCTTFDVASMAPLWPDGPILAAPANAAGESVEVVSVALSTSVTAAVVAPGDFLRDRITVEGLPRWGGMRALEVRLVGPVPAPASDTCDGLADDAFAAAPVIASATMTIGSDGTYESPTLIAPRLDGQCVTFEIVDGAPLWPGGPVVRSPRGLSAETALIRRPPAGPPSSIPPSPIPPSSIPPSPIPPSPTPDAPAAVGAPAPANDVPALADTGPPDARRLLAAAMALLSAGAGLLLLIPASPGSPVPPSTRRRTRRSVR